MPTRLRFLSTAVLLAAMPLALTSGAEKSDKRHKLDTRSQKVLDRVLAESARARELFGEAIGYAVFSNTKAALGVSGGAGNGVAVDKATGERTYMKMGTAGIGFGLGVKTYQVVMFFNKENVFHNFVDHGWQGNAQAGAAAGTKAVAAEMTFHNGVALFVRTMKGLMASADVSGTKYWKSDLND